MTKHYIPKQILNYNCAFILGNVAFTNNLEIGYETLLDLEDSIFYNNKLYICIKKLDIKVIVEVEPPFENTVSIIRDIDSSMSHFCFSIDDFKALITAYAFNCAHDFRGTVNSIQSIIPILKKNSDMITHLEDFIEDARENINSNLAIIGKKTFISSSLEDIKKLIKEITNRYRGFKFKFNIEEFKDNISIPIYSILSFIGIILNKLLINSFDDEISVESKVIDGFFYLTYSFPSFTFKPEHLDEIFLFCNSNPNQGLSFLKMACDNVHVVLSGSDLKFISSWRVER